MNCFLYSSSYNPSLIQNTLFELKLLSQGSIEQEHLSKSVKNSGLNEPFHGLEPILTAGPKL